MKAISKFKSLISPRSTPARQTTPHHNIPPSIPSSPAPEEKVLAAQSTAEFATRVLRERQEFLASGGKASFDLLTTTSSSSVPSAATNPTSSTDTPPNPDHHPQQPAVPTHLGIGTGGIDGFTHTTDHHHPAAAGGEGEGEVVVVSDSPTAVDFNVYDAAFDAEIERIKRSTSRRGAGPRGRGGGAGGPIYQTRFRERREGGGGGGAGGGAVQGGGFARVGGGAVVGQRGVGMGFAEVVPKAVERAREEMGAGAASEGQLREEGQAQ